MSWIRSKGPFTILIFLAFWVMIFSIIDVIFNKNWINITLGLYIALIILSFIVLIMRSRKKQPVISTVEEFEKTLKGGLFHFKCPTCNGIFAIKKSKANNKKYVKMTCPDCGALGCIPPNPSCVEEVIPEKKSVKANFKCLACGEGITVWAEGTDLYDGTSVYCCPFCGEQKELERF